MALYKYIARTASGDKVQGTLHADSHQLALARLHNLGYFPFAVDAERSTPSPKKKGWLQRLSLRRSNLASFYRQLADLLEGGLTVPQAFELLVKQQPQESVHEQLKSILGHLRNGGSLSDGLKLYPSTFAPCEIGIVDAGEASGTLEGSLTRLAEFKEHQAELRARITASLAYPALLLLLSFLAVVTLMVFVLPNLIPLFDQVNQTLPWPTRLLIALSEFMTGYGLILIGVALVGILLIGPGRLTRYVKTWLQTVSLRVPVVRDIVRKSELSRFTRTLETLLASGVSILVSWEIACDAISNPRMRQSFKASTQQIARGSKVADSLKGNEFVIPSLISIIAVGEESNSLELALRKVAASYRRQLDTTTKLLTTLLEPAMIVVIGAFVGFIIFSMLLPIFQLDVGGL